jgi:hypothetical protein
MSNEVGGPDGPPAGPITGEIRFTAAGDLEAFDGVTWGPLHRLSDPGTNMVMRHVEPVLPPTSDPSDDGDGSDGQTSA